MINISWNFDQYVFLDLRRGHHFLQYIFESVDVSSVSFI